ncbi:MAG: heme o synthase [Planctomycetota bacterium]|jgi:protoheme IX farnesyltransferase
MSVASSSTASVVTPDTLPAPRSRAGVVADLTKARLSAMVVLTTAVGFVLATRGDIDWLRLLWTTAGTALAAASACALNQVLEIQRDRRMIRTASRPLPSGAATVQQATVLGIVLGTAGVLLLATLVHPAAAGLALLTIVIYTALYTPLKTRTTLNTLVGAVCGALPPMIGWVAVAGRLEPGAWLLAALMFVWQLPHFLALAWLYRDDYARGGFVMLPNRDAGGELTARVGLAGSVVLMLIAVLGVLAGLAGWIFGGVALAGGLWMTILGWRFCLDRSDANARRVFQASLVYLAAVMGLLLVDAGPAPLIGGL